MNQTQSLYTEAPKSFSKLSKREKVQHIIEHSNHGKEDWHELLKSFWHPHPGQQSLFDEFSENTLSNFYVPFGVVPHFKLNGQLLTIPMVIEESSVVAACSKAAKFWATRGGFRAKVISTEKNGQVHFYWQGLSEDLMLLFENSKQELIEATEVHTASMRKRGGGLLELKLLDKTDVDENYYQLWASFETCDAMGANFINTVLETVGNRWKEIVAEKTCHQPQIVMSILSNFTPECLVRASVRCSIDELDDGRLGMAPSEFAEKFVRAVKIAQLDPYRATTHNKGIMNGVDAVVIATGNDFRATEACAHAYASRNGQYQSLTNALIQDDHFEFSIEIPLALGTIGGLTALHPLAKLSLELLDQPTAKDLMMVAASTGLAQNFAAIKSLVTTGIQKGHMKMHLKNILKQLEASPIEEKEAKKYFANKIISYQSVREYLSQLRNYQ